MGGPCNSRWVNVSGNASAVGATAATSYPSVPVCTSMASGHVDRSQVACPSDPSGGGSSGDPSGPGGTRDPTGPGDSGNGQSPDEPKGSNSVDPLQGSDDDPSGWLISVLVLVGLLGVCSVPLLLKGIQRAKASLEDRSEALARQERLRRGRVERHMRSVSQASSPTRMVNPMVDVGEAERFVPGLCGVCSTLCPSTASRCFTCGTRRSAWRRGPGGL